MPRGLDGAFASALSAGKVKIALFVYFELRNGVRRLWTGMGDYSWAGNVWTGSSSSAGKDVGIIRLDKVTDTMATKVSGISVIVDGLPPTSLSEAFLELKRGNGGKLWLAMLDDSITLIGTPSLLFDARLDTALIDHSPEKTTIQISWENRMIDMEKPRGGLYTHEDQQLYYPGDFGFEFVPQLLDRDIPWGAAGSGGSGAGASPPSLLSMITKIQSG